MNGNEKVDGDCDEDERPESDSGLQSSEESLLSLVQPELVALSKSWLAALKDHALLSLPPGEPLSHSLSPTLLFAEPLSFLLNETAPLIILSH